MYARPCFLWTLLGHCPPLPLSTRPLYPSHPYFFLPQVLQAHSHSQVLGFASPVHRMLLHQDIPHFFRSPSKVYHFEETFVINMYLFSLFFLIRVLIIIRNILCCLFIFLLSFFPDKNVSFVRTEIFLIIVTYIVPKM